MRSGSSVATPILKEFMTAFQTRCRLEIFVEASDCTLVFTGVKVCDKNGELVAAETGDDVGITETGD